MIEAADIFNPFTEGDNSSEVQDRKRRIKKALPSLMELKKEHGFFESAIDGAMKFAYGKSAVKCAERYCRDESRLLAILREVSAVEESYHDRYSFFLDVASRKHGGADSDEIMRWVMDRTSYFAAAFQAEGAEHVLSDTDALGEMTAAGMTALEMYVCHLSCERGWTNQEVIEDPALAGCSAGVIMLISFAGHHYERLGTELY